MTDDDGRSTTRPKGRPPAIPRPPAVPRPISDLPSPRTISQHPGYESPSPPSPAPVDSAIRDMVRAVFVEERVWLEKFIVERAQAEVSKAMKAGATAVAAEPDPTRAKLEAELRQARELADHYAKLATVGAGVQKTLADARKLDAETEIGIPAEMRSKRGAIRNGMITALAAILVALGGASWFSHCAAKP